MSALPRISDKIMEILVSYTVKQIESECDMGDY